MFVPNVSNITIVPPVKPRLLPLILTILSPRLARIGASISVVESLTPPLECLSKHTPKSDRSILFPEFSIAVVSVTVSFSVMPFSQITFKSSVISSSESAPDV